MRPSPRERQASLWGVALRLSVLVLLGAFLSACSLTNKLFGNDSGEARAAALLRLQLTVMRFADEYAASVTTPITAIQRTTDDPHERLAAQNWLVSQVTAAYTIASGPNPELNTIDMVVFATLSRMVVDEISTTDFNVDRAKDLQEAHALLEERAWAGARPLMTPSQTDELIATIDGWHQRNPKLRIVAYTHLSDFALEANKGRSAALRPGSVFSLLGIDPLSNLDPAVRELTQARQLAERALYYAQRTPKLIDLEVQRAAFELAVMPESVKLLQDLNRVSIAAQETGKLASTMPELLATERAAAIEQLMDALDSRKAELQSLIVELRSTLEAGTATSDSLKATITSFDALMSRFEKPEATDASPARPFDVTEYAETARQLGDAARQLEALFVQVDGNVPALTQLSERTSERMRELMDHAFWRLVQLALVIVAAILIGALGYRFIVRR